MALFRQMLKSKIQGAVITKRELYYSGSIGIDKALLCKSDISAGEKVHVLNFNNGKRFETYIIEETKNSGVIALYGPAARLGELGDRLCIISYVFADEKDAAIVKPVIVSVDNKNRGI